MFLLKNLLKTNVTNQQGMFDVRVAYLIDTLWENFCFSLAHNVKYFCML